MEITRELEVNAPKSVVMEYFSNPQNLLPHIPAFRNLKQIDKNTWEMDLKWLITLKLIVKREILTDEVIYTIKKTEGNIKISAYLRHVILQKGLNKTLVKILYFYQGPFEGTIAKRQAEEYFDKGMKIVEEDLNRIMKERMKEEIKIEQKQGDGIEIKEDLLRMETLFAKEIDKGELESVIAKAMIESIGSEILLLVSDGKNIVQLKFKDGSLEESKGSVDVLGNKVKVLMKRKAINAVSITDDLKSQSLNEWQ